MIFPGALMVANNLLQFFYIYQIIMLDLKEIPNIIEALNELIHQNQQDSLNLQAGFNPLISKQNYLEQKLDGFDKITNLTVKAFETLLELNQRKNQIQLGNQGLRQDLCEICLINTQLQDQIFQKDKVNEDLKKQLQTAVNKIEKLQKQKKLYQRNNFERIENDQFQSLIEDRQSIIMPEKMQGITLIQSKIEAYTNQKHFDQIWDMRVQIEELKATITKLTSVIGFMEEREELRRQEDQLRLLQNQEKQNYSNEQSYKKINKKQYQESQEQRDEIQEEKILKTLAYSKSSQSLADDLVQLDEKDDSETSIKMRMNLLKVESAPTFYNYLDRHYQIETKKLSKKVQKLQDHEIEKFDHLADKNEKNSATSKTIKSLFSIHHWLKQKIVSQRVIAKLQLSNKNRIY